MVRVEFSALAVVLLVCLAVAAADDARRGDADNGNAAAPSYGDLALKMTIPSFEKTISDLKELKESSMPTGVKKIRKSILYTRNLLDVFAFAFPIVMPTPSPAYSSPRFSLLNNLLFCIFRW